MSKKLLIVIGAGASKEFDLPIGNELKTQISRALNFKVERGGYDISGGDEVIFQALNIESQIPGNNYGALFSAAKHIFRAIPQAQSIDNFIDAHANNKCIELVGKLAITSCILKAERNSKLYINQRSGNSTLDFSKLEDVWLTKFMRILVENSRLEDMPERMKSVSMIIFNYDRCVEHFLMHALANYYGIGLEKSQELVEMMHIYHPYGTVGSLKYNGSVTYDGSQNYNGSSQVIGFGAEPDGKLLLALSKGIKTFSEGTDESTSDIAEIRSLVKNVPTTIWLGFAFHHLNMRLLSNSFVSKISDHGEKQSFATAYGMSKHDTLLIAEEIERITSVAKYSKTLNANVRNDVQCYQLFGEYTRSISLVN